MLAVGDEHPDQGEQREDGATGEQQQLSCVAVDRDPDVADQGQRELRSVDVRPVQEERVPEVGGAVCVALGRDQ